MDKTRKLTKIALAAAAKEGASYADIRFVSREMELVQFINGSVSGLDKTESTGFGIRVLAHGAWGFDCSNVITETEIKKVAGSAVRLAKAAAVFNKKKVVLLPVAPCEDYWGAKVKIDPFLVTLKQKVALLREIDAKAREISGVKATNAGTVFEREHKIFASSEGSYIVQDLIYSGAGYTLTMTDGTGTMPVDFNSEHEPSGWNNCYLGMGYERVNAENMLNNIGAVAAKGLELLADIKSAKPCPPGIYACLGGLDIHHFAGHPIELDRILGAETNFAGTTFVKASDVGKMQLGSELINLEVNGNTHFKHKPSPDFHKYWKYFDVLQNKGDIYSPANYGYDDEGVPAKRMDIVKKGRLVACLNSRETAFEQGQNYLTASMRAHGWNRPPIIRMHNMHLLPGKTSLKKMIESTENGLIIGPYIPGLGAGNSASQSRDRTKTYAQLGLSWLIKNGKVTRPVVGGVRMYEPLKLWNSVDAVCNEEVIHLDLPRCGKGQPHQSVSTFHRGSILRQKKGVIE